MAMSRAGRGPAPTVEIGSHAAGEPIAWSGTTVVAVDVIRSTTTAITAVALGRRCYPAGSVEEAAALASTLVDPLLAGELGGELVPGFHLGNSPAAVAARTDVERPLVLLSSSGTVLMSAAAAAGDGAVLVACLRNIGATITHLAAGARSVALASAETRGEFREEDKLCCARIAAGLLDVGFQPAGSMTREIVRRWAHRATEDLVGRASSRYLEATGQSDDLRFILEHVEDLDRAYVLHLGEVVAVPASARTEVGAGVAAPDGPG
jgi:2-phosphosulfolactate phosphatase